MNDLYIAAEKFHDSTRKELSISITVAIILVFILFIKVLVILATTLIPFVGAVVGVSADSVISFVSIISKIYLRSVIANNRVRMYELSQFKEKNIKTKEDIEYVERKHKNIAFWIYISLIIDIFKLIPNLISNLIKIIPGGGAFSLAYRVVSSFGYGIVELLPATMMLANYRMVINGSKNIMEKSKSGEY